MSTEAIILLYWARTLKLAHFYNEPAEDIEFIEKCTREWAAKIIAGDYSAG